MITRRRLIRPHPIQTLRVLDTLRPDLLPLLLELGRERHTLEATLLVGMIAFLLQLIDEQLPVVTGPRPGLEECSAPAGGCRDYRDENSDEPLGHGGPSSGGTRRVSRKRPRIPG